MVQVRLPDGSVAFMCGPINRTAATDQLRRDIIRLAAEQQRCPNCMGPVAECPSCEGPAKSAAQAIAILRGMVAG